MKDYKRTKKFINYKFQSLIALEVMLHALIMPILIVILLVVDPFSTLFSNATAETHLRAATELFKLNINKLPLLIILLLFIGLLSIVFSHHIAGPAFRFVRTFRWMIDKDLTHRIRLRKWDYLKEVSKEFNNIVDNLSDEIKTIRLASQEISNLAESTAKSKPELKKELDGILAHSKRIEGVTGKYKLQNQ